MHCRRICSSIGSLDQAGYAAMKAVEAAAERWWVASAVRVRLHFGYGVCILNGWPTRMGKVRVLLVVRKMDV